MKPSDRRKFLEIVIGFAELRGKQLSAPALELYWNAMQDWDLADFQSAANLLLKTCEWMPLPHHFEELRKAGRMTAGEAFAKTLEWARTGAYRHPAKTPEAIFIDRVVQALGGWAEVASYEEGKLHFLEKSFREHFETIEDATDTRLALPQLAEGEIAKRIRDHISDPLRAVKRVTAPLDAVGRDPAPYGKATV
jgi:hypothetical protein